MLSDRQWFKCEFCRIFPGTRCVDCISSLTDDGGNSFDAVRFLQCGMFLFENVWSLKELVKMNSFCSCRNSLSKVELSFYLNLSLEILFATLSRFKIFRMKLFMGLDVKLLFVFCQFPFLFLGGQVLFQEYPETEFPYMRLNNAFR